VGFEVLPAALFRFRVLWDFSLSMGESFQTFRKNIMFSYYVLKTEAVCFSKKLVPTQWTERWHNPGDDMSLFAIVKTRNLPGLAR
jgi:hypothetical protein